MRLARFSAALAVALCGWAFAAEPPGVTPEMRIVADHISAGSLRGHVSFLASDLLEGRDTPSRGLDIAAEYIASQFRRIGLEPAGDDGYFQTARMAVLAPNFEGFEITLGQGQHSLAAAPTDAAPIGIDAGGNRSRASGQGAPWCGHRTADRGPRRRHRVMIVEQRVHSAIKRMCRGHRQVGRRDPQVLLLLPLLSSAHRHT